MSLKAGENLPPEDSTHRDQRIHESAAETPPQDEVNTSDVRGKPTNEQCSGDRAVGEQTDEDERGEKPSPAAPDEGQVEPSTIEETRRRKKKRRRRKDAWEKALQGRRDLCYTIEEIVPLMLKMVMTRVASSYRSTRGLSEEQLREDLTRCAGRIAKKGRVVAAISALDPDRDRRTLKGIIVFDVLLEQERYALPSGELNEKVLDYEKQILKESKQCKLLDAREQDKNRLAAYETYNVVLEAAWRHQEKISPDEANLLAELRGRLGITLREHRLLEAKMGRFPKAQRGLHSLDEIENTRRQLQKEAILWTFRDENGKNVDAIPAEIMHVIRTEIKRIELQSANYQRLLANKGWSNKDLRTILRANGRDARGKKSDMVHRILQSRLTPTQLLQAASVSKLQALCREVGLVSYGAKTEVMNRLIDFYDNLTFKLIVERDERAQQYAVYELLAARKYSELKAQGVIEKQEDVDRAFEQATDFLFQERLKLPIEKNLPAKSADGKVYLHDRQEVVLWDCKSGEKEVKLHDHLESQFDGYMRAESQRGFRVLYFLVIGPRFTKRSSLVARKYKMATNWDIPLITASALKHIAEKWHDAKPTRPFPIGLLNLTEIVDEDRADELLSLVL